MHWPPPDSGIRRMFDELRERVGDEKMKDFLPRNDYRRYVHTGAARTDLDVRELLAAGITRITFETLAAYDPRHDAERTAEPASASDEAVARRVDLVQALHIEIGPGAAGIVQALDRYLSACSAAAAEQARAGVAEAIRRGSFR